MRMSKSYEFRSIFPLCELSAREDLGLGPVGGGGGERGPVDIRPIAQRLPFFVCATVILLLSVECYVAAYEILAALVRFFSASSF